ncbi:class I SAM-dependent methyltransferase [Mycobacterium sp. HUMS_1102779]|uniref:class I SAM-dependent methyltransferase n=1 Tax=Mycobacterium sp. HUMS_1102779 TaxID=3383487 RepID=UPI00389A9E7A
MGGFDTVLCRICTSNTQLAFTRKVLAKYDCRYYFCPNCGGLQTEEPYWLEEAYASPVASADTGILVRNLDLAQATSLVLFFLFDRRGRFLDAAGGYGIFTRLMRDLGFDYYWTDKYCPNLTARGFEADESSRLPYTAVTAFEVMEHLPDPVAFLAELLESTGTDTIIFTTELFAGEPPAPEAWWYYCFATGQHISFYQKSTLELIGKRFGMRFHSSGTLHVWTRAKLNPLALRLLSSPQVSGLLRNLPPRILGSRTWADHEKLMGIDGG